MKQEIILFEDQFIDIMELQKQLQFTYLEKLVIHPKEDGKVILEDTPSLDPVTAENGKKYKDLIESSFTPKVSVRWISEEIGYGLFAEEEISENSYVGEYVGEIRKNNEHGEFNHYLYKYPILDSIGRNYVIDATCGNLLRFANHSFAFNMKHSYAFIAPFYHAIFIAARPIMKGEQLTYSYGKNYWYLRGSPAAL